MLSLNWFVKSAVISGTALGLVDIFLQGWEQGLYAPHLSIPKHTSAHAPNAYYYDPRTCGTFEWDIMRTMRDISFGAVIAPAYNGITLVFANPAAWVHTAINVAAATAIFGPVAVYLRVNQDSCTLEAARPYIVPLLVGGTVVNFFATYAVSAAMGHTALLWPMISYLGELPPESVIFTLGVGFSAAMYALLVSTVARQKAINGEEDVNDWLSVRAATAAGYISVVGMSCIAVFPSHALAAVPHYVGMTSFFLGSVPFLLMMSPVTVEEVATDEDTGEVVKSVSTFSGYRTGLMALYTASSLMYPGLVWNQLDLAAAVSETLSGMAWIALLMNGRHSVTQGPSVEDVIFEETAPGVEEIVLDASAGGRTPRAMRSPTPSELQGPSFSHTTGGGIGKPTIVVHHRHFHSSVKKHHTTEKGVQVEEIEL
eukprot:PhM_4_TR9020/c0_g1_i1/m.105644